ncbi:molybdopterin-dependent oxidoreductase (plasmid) [Peteryoungia desertarenae]|uniref:Molybdopterin-dependent oxidoreductase n=1 Tax=Peteryoungia desertarenae TaxID=1813451 RepID=A0ABX6QTN9_9HYPH|nr:nitrate reductase [Peteryoungia desertarenae]QLF71900.1 molybdopterin-dependent oxidoreductase [Peteryoungia desertarenae]
MVCETRTTCPYCGVGCGVIATVDDAGAVSVRGDPEHPANLGRLCSKGSALGETLDLDGRALFPMIDGRRARWDDALDLVAARFSAAIDAYGPDSVAFYVSGQLLTEDYYVANKLMKGFVGSANIDTNSRLCMASSVAGHRRAFGADTVPGCYEDLELADLIVLAGSNTAWCHPVLYQRIASAKARRPGLKVVVIDPRRTSTTDIADLHLAIRPDADVALFAGLFSHLVRAGAIDQSYIARHTTGFAEAFAAVDLSMADLIEATGLPSMQLREFFRLFAETEKVVTCYSQGINQSSCGTDKVNAILNCHLATGRIGRPGMGPFSLTGQPNAMGGREVGGLSNMLAAHMALENAADRERVQRFWNAPSIAQRPGLKAVDMFDAVADGRIKSLWIMSTNPVVSMPDADRVREAIRSCPFVVVSDIVAHTDTARLAHVLLPATGWGEKSGTVTNSERRISRQRAFLSAPEEARPDWWQISEVARRMGFGEAFDYSEPHQIFAEHAALSAFENNGMRDFDIGAWEAVTSEAYDALQPFQWPQRAGTAPSETRFFGDGVFYHGDNRARLVPVKPSMPAHHANEQEFILNSGRVRDHWHTMTRTGKSARLSAHMGEPFVELHPLDAEKVGIADADLVDVRGGSNKGVLLRALITERQQRGSVFVPMHWTAETSSLGRIDTLVPPLVDPISGQPALKQARVAITRYEAKAYGFAVSIAKPVLDECSYWAIGKAEHGWRTEFALDQSVLDWEKWARAALGIAQDAQVANYRDEATGQVRIAFTSAGHLVAAIHVDRRPVSASRDWLASQLMKDISKSTEYQDVLAGRPGRNRPDPGAIVCACFGVGANQIAQAASLGCMSVEAVGEALSAGTNCGSCRPEIRRIIDAHQPIAAE